MKPIEDESYQYSFGTLAWDKREEQLIIDWKRQGSRALVSHATNLLHLTCFSCQQKK